MMQALSKQHQRSVRWISLWALFVGWLSTSSVVSAGEMYHWVDEQGRVHLTDIPPLSKRGLQELKVYKGSGPPPQHENSGPPPAEAGRAKLSPTKPGGTVIVEAMLNRRLMVPMVLDTGADFTVLTRQVAKELRIAVMDRLPKLQFKTAADAVDLPITTLQSLRVGTAEAHDVNVAIDIDGHMPVGLLGMTFLRHFKVIVDQQRGQVSFER